MLSDIAEIRGVSSLDSDQMRRAALGMAEGDHELFGALHEQLFHVCERLQAGMDAVCSRRQGRAGTFVEQAAPPLARLVSVLLKVGLAPGSTGL